MKGSAGGRKAGRKGKGPRGGGHGKGRGAAKAAAPPPPAPDEVDDPASRRLQRAQEMLERAAEIKRQKEAAKLLQRDAEAVARKDARRLSEERVLEAERRAANRGPLCIDPEWDGQIERATTLLARLREQDLEKADAAADAAS